jgi:hypothetical protein
MIQLTPPQPPARLPLVALSDDDGLQAFRRKLRLLSWTTITILVTAWFCTFGPAAAVIALVIAKHILVALLVMGLGVDSSRDE